MNTRFLISVAIAVGILSPGCTRQDNSADTPAFRTVEVEGTYGAGFEYSQFRQSTPEFAGKVWWLNSNQEFNDRYGDENEPGQRMFGPSVVVRLRGRLMGPGKYGHLEQWKYNFTVEEVIEMRRAGAALDTAHETGVSNEGQAESLTYEAAQWGNIKGRVVFAGDEIPEPKLLVRKGDPNAKDAACCAAEDIFSEDLVVNRENRGLRWVVVYVNKPPALHPDSAQASGDVEFTKKHCVYKPHVIAFRAGQKVKYSSTDPIACHLGGDGFKNGFMYRIDPAPQGGESVVEIAGIVPEPRPIAIKCSGVHPWLKAWWAVFDHPYFAVTDENGAFEINNLPAGKVRFVVWQEKIGFGDGKGVGKEIEVKANETADLGELKLELPRAGDGKGSGNG